MPKIKGFGTNMKKQILSVILKWTSFASAAIAAILQTVAMLISYEGKENYFLVGMPLPYLATAFTLLGMICGILFAALYESNNEKASPLDCHASFALPSTLGMLACAVLLFLFADGTLSIAASAALLIAASYTLLSVTAVRKNHTTALILLGFSAVAACALMNGYYYFDATMEMNSPLKVTPQIALLFAMIYYTAELRYLLDRQKPRLYLALAMITLAASALPAVSIPVAFCAGIVTRTDYLAGALLSLGIAITVLLRVAYLLRAQKRIPELITESNSVESASDEIAETAIDPEQSERPTQPDSEEEAE